MDLFTELILLAWIIGLAIVMYFLGIRNMHMDKKCTARTEGIVIGVSNLRYGENIHIPLISYEVDGKKYQVAGPKFKSASITEVYTPFGDPNTKCETNLTTRDNLPDKLVVKIHGNSMVSSFHSPLLALYPVGSRATVYYDPKKPKRAYVERYVEMSKLISIMVPATGIIACIILEICFLLNVFHY